MADTVQPGAAHSAPAALAAAPIIIPRDTPIHLMTLTEVTTKTDTIGHRFKLRVNPPDQANAPLIYAAISAKCSDDGQTAPVKRFAKGYDLV